MAACRRHFDGTALLINCGDADGSRAHFHRLGDVVGDDMWWLEWPLRKHGLALDELFACIPARRVLLVDSDLEIRGGSIVDVLFVALAAAPDAYGAGFLQASTWLMPPVHNLPPHVAFYATRPWIPLVLLDVGKVRGALDAGASFLADRSFAEAGGGWHGCWRTDSDCPVCVACACRVRARGCRRSVRSRRRRGSIGILVPVCMIGCEGAACRLRLHRTGIGRW